MRGKWVPGAGLCLLLLAWVLAAYVGGPDGFPSPSAVFTSLAARAKDGTLWHGILLSFRRLLIGYAMSVAVGSVLGLAMAASDTFRRAFSPVIIGLSALPSICWLPMGLLWFGLSDAAILFVIVLGSSLSIAIAIDAGCRHVTPLYVRAGRTMGASGWTLYRRVVLPAALPEIVTGLRLAWAFAWRSLMAGELLFVTGGLGHLLQTGRELGDMAQVVAVMIVIVALGIATEQVLFATFQDKLRERWGRVTEH